MKRNNFHLVDAPEFDEASVEFDAMYGGNAERIEHLRMTGRLEGCAVTGVPIKYVERESQKVLYGDE